jgi:hypothetical protein
MFLRQSFEIEPHVVTLAGLCDVPMNLAAPQIPTCSRALLRLRSAALLCGLAVALAGCSSTPFDKIGDSLPASIGGLPADTPERPAAPPAYPAVHDMPPPRPNTTLSAEEQIQLENELTAVRVRQDVITGAAPAKKPKPQPQPQAQTAPAPRVVPASSTDSIY